ncbi:MAG: 4-vinyl reductase [Clostridiales bacterium]|nr:4-vinyl reductase [Clostridiales bacterium]
MKELGDIGLGRPNMGQDMPVLIYRLFELAIMDVLETHYGKKTADDLIREAGYKSGMIFGADNITKNLDFNEFITELQNKLADNKIGILRIENADLAKGEITLCVYEDLDCSGLPVSDEQICVYDEGFISGVLEYYTGTKFNVREVDCWASGERVCRFKAKTV